MMIDNDRLNSAEVCTIQCMEYFRVYGFQDFHATRRVSLFYIFNTIKKMPRRAIVPRHQCDFITTRRRFRRVEINTLTIANVTFERIYNNQFENRTIPRPCLPYRAKTVFAMAMYSSVYRSLLG